MVVAIIFFIVAWFIFMPVMSTGFLQLIFLIGVSGGIWAAFSFSKEDGEDKLGKILSLSIVVIATFVVFVGNFFSSGLFRADSYHGLIGKVETIESTASGKLEKVTDPKYIRTVDKDTAKTVMDKKLGEIQALGSQYDVGDPDIQRVGSGLYWVAPLEYQDFFKYASLDSIPGYVKVSASDQSDVELVTSYGSGNKIKMTKSPSAFFSNDLERYVYFNGSMTRGFTDYSFEIDDTGKPYWVITTYSHKVGFSGDDADGVIIVDPEEGGEIKWYAIDKVPSWVDRVQPENFIADQINDWGEYVHGWLNPSNQDRLKVTTTDLRLTYGTDGRPYWYAGIANYSANNGSINGFMLVDTVTKVATFHREAGASEDAAKKSAEGKVQQMGYVSTNPVLYSVNGIPSYVMALKDKSGLMKQVAFVSVKDFSIVGIGDTSEEAYRNYRNELSKNRDASAPGPSKTEESVSGKVKRVSQFVSKGETYVMFIITRTDGKFEDTFIGSVDNFRDLAMTREGDIVKVSYSKDDLEKGMYRISSFVNFVLTPSE